MKYWRKFSGEFVAEKRLTNLSIIPGCPILLPEPKGFETLPAVFMSDLTGFDVKNSPNPFCNETTRAKPFRLVPMTEQGRRYSSGEMVRLLKRFDCLCRMIRRNSSARKCAYLDERVGIFITDSNMQIIVGMLDRLLKKHSVPMILWCSHERFLKRNKWKGGYVDTLKKVLILSHTRKDCSSVTVKWTASCGGSGWGCESRCGRKKVKVNHNAIEYD